MKVKAQKVPGRRSGLCIIFPEPHRHHHRPLLLMAHGALRSADDLLPWSARWTDEFDVALVDLPGHGRSDAPAEISFQAFADELRFLVSDTFAARRVAIIGESLSGTFGLATASSGPANLAAVVALDPPLSTANLWPIGDVARKAFQLHPQEPFLETFFFEMFGVRAGARAIEERQYAKYLDQLSVPALILAGDIIGGSSDQPMPSLLDAVDRDLIRRGPAHLHELAGAGHRLVDLCPAETYAAARNFILGLPSG